MKRLLLLLITISLLVTSVGALTWTPGTGCWTATIGNDSLTMWNVSGTYHFTVPSTTTYSYVVIAGGASGGGWGSGRSGGGGGAGGVLNGTITLTPGSYDITIGDGGIQVAANTTANGNPGENSSFATNDLQAMGGGYGGTLASPYHGGDGGSGGGAGGDNSWAGGAGYLTQGKSGGAGHNPDYNAGGGGGFSSVGADATNGDGGDGGSGFTEAITGESLVWATGGKGGKTGTDGGTNATSYGSGGEGVGSASLPSGKGMSGVVIIRSVAPAPISASFTQSPNPSHAWQQVNFTDTSTGDVSGWIWYFGDDNPLTNSSSLQNPTHVFYNNGVFNVTLHAVNMGNFSDYSDTYQYHTVTTASSFTQQDIWMTAQYVLRVHVVDSNNLPIVSATMTDTATGNVYSTSNGTIFATYPFQAWVGVISSTGYQSIQKSAFIDRDTDVTVMLPLAPANATQTNNIIWQPYAIAIQVLDANLNPIVNDPVEMTAYDSSLPGGLAGGAAYFQTTYGASAATAASMFSANTTYRGNTDDNGFISTQVVNIIEYKIVTKDTAGNNVTTLIWPHGSYYQIKTGTALIPGIAAIGVAQNNIYKNSTFNTTFWEPNTTTACMGVNVYDSTGQTTIVSAWWKLIDNSTTWWTNTSISGYGPVNSTKCVPHVPYQQWKWGGITG